MLSLAALTTLAAYSIFEPTPDAALSEDLASATAAVDPGRVQLEIDTLTLGVDAEDIGADVFGVNARLGVAHGFELSLATPALGASLHTTPGLAGDFHVGVLWSVLAGDAGELSLHPHVDVATDAVATGGLAVPTALALPADFTLETQADFDWVRGAQSDLAAGVSAHLSHDIVEDVGGYVQVAASTTLASHENAGWVCAGATWRAAPELEFDVGTRARVVGDAPRGEAYLALHYRP